MTLRSTTEDQTKKKQKPKTSYWALSSTPRGFTRTCSLHLLPRVPELGKTSVPGAACQGAAAGPGSVLSEVSETASSLREKSTKAVLDPRTSKLEAVSGPRLPFLWQGGNPEVPGFAACEADVLGISRRESLDFLLFFGGVQSALDLNKPSSYFKAFMEEIGCF